MISFLIAAQAAVLMSSTPQDVVPAANATPAPQSQQAERRYCVVGTVTGSRIPQKICKTRKQWMSDDQFDPLNP